LGDFGLALNFSILIQHRMNASENMLAKLNNEQRRWKSSVCRLGCKLLHHLQKTYGVCRKGWQIPWD